MQTFAWKTRRLTLLVVLIVVLSSVLHRDLLSLLLHAFQIKISVVVVVRAEHVVVVRWRRLRVLV